MVTLLALRASASAIPFATQQEQVNRLWTSTVKHSGVEAAVDKLLAVAVDPDADVHMREFSVDKLAEVRAVQATDAVRALAESLSWNNDRERELANRTTRAYHELRYLREPNSERGYELLIDSLKNGKGAANHWAVDELIRRKYRRALPLIAEAIRHRNSTERGESYIRLCRLRFDVMSRDDELKDRLEEVISGDSPALAELSYNERERMQSWARRELRLLRTVPNVTRWLYAVAATFLGVALAGTVFYVRRARRRSQQQT